MNRSWGFYEKLIQTRRLQKGRISFWRHHISIFWGAHLIENPFLDTTSKDNNVFNSLAT
jgi:hypothetical protein